MLAGAAGAAGLTAIAAIVVSIQPIAVDRVRAHIQRPDSSVTPQAQAGAASFGQPLPGLSVVSPFGLRQLPWETNPRLHAGVDIAAPQGTQVLAIAEGVVVRIGQAGGYGTFIEVEHSRGLKSLYAHLNNISDSIGVGAAVFAGTPLGQVGLTGSTTGAHLHLELRAPDGAPLDPSYFLGRLFDDVNQWPVQAAAKISPRVRYAVASAWPQSRWELLIAAEEGAGPLAAGDPVPEDAVSGRAPESPAPMEGAALDGSLKLAVSPQADTPGVAIVPPDPTEPPAPSPHASAAVDAPKPKPRSAFPTGFGG